MNIIHLNREKYFNFVIDYMFQSAKIITVRQGERK